MLNLHLLNQFLRKDKLRYKDLLFDEKGFFFKFDLESSYHHEDIMKTIISVGTKVCILEIASNRIA